jgi:hypothetical protein
MFFKNKLNCFFTAKKRVTSITIETIMLAERIDGAGRYVTFVVDEVQFRTE